MACFLEAGPMRGLAGSAQDFIGELMGHFMKQNFPNGIPGMVEDQPVAQVDFPFGF